MNEKENTDKHQFFPVWLLRSKVSPTRQRVDLLERHSHTLKLHQSLDASLSLISAPAGYGKSTLLANWREILQTEGHLVCWLSLSRQDNEPLQLLTYIAFALSTGGVHFDSDQEGMEFRLNDLSEQEFLSLIVHFVAETPRRVVLILDDFENLDAAVVDSVILSLLEYAPDNLHLSIASRDDTHLKISNLEARGLAVRFGAAQLRFTPIELNDFLAEEYDSQTIGQIYSLTEGWPVAVQMIRGAIRNEGDVERILNDLGGDSTQIAAYLSEEVLSSLDPTIQEFLMDVSLIDRIDCEFADYLREESDSLARFIEARALDALVLPIEDMDGAYRMHPLFREHLYERLTVTRPTRQKALHLRASSWFSGRADLVEAIRHSVLAGDIDNSLIILSASGGLMLWFREGLARLRAIMKLYDEESITGNWQLAVIRCLMDIKDGKVNQARKLHDAVAAKLEVPVHDLNQLSKTSSLHEFVMMEIVISIYEGKPISDEVMDEIESKINAMGPEDVAVRSNLLTFLCIGNLQRGRFIEARKFGELSRPAFLASGSLYGAAYIDFHLGEINFAEGNSKQAAWFYQRGLEITKKHFNDDQSMKLVVNILVAELDYELNDLRNGNSVTRIVPRFLEKNEAWFDIYAAGYSVSALLEFDDYGIDAALAIIDRAVEYTELNQLFRLTKFLTCLRVDLLLRAGLTKQARTVLQQSGIAIEDYHAPSENQIAWRERDAAVQSIVRLLIHEDQNAEALSVLKYFSKQARADGHVRARMKYKILLAIAHAGCRDPMSQFEQLHGALGLFDKSGFIRPFLDEKVALAPMLRQYLDKSEMKALALRSSDFHDKAKLLLEQMGSHADDGEVAPLLSPRESQVLRELTHGFSNKVIARRIDISESTVRFHLRNIFVKLNVSSRLQAVSVARERGLV